MVKVNIIAVGKVKEKYFSEGIKEYEKRLSRYCKFLIKEVGEENSFDKGETTTVLIKNKEGEKILPLLNGYVIVCALEGKKLSSEKLSEKIETLKTEGVSEITFVIGGSYGLSDAVKKRADFMLSVSDMTFPHTLFRLILTEQIYRAFTISENLPYHK